jgi:hypothetical protein
LREGSRSVLMQVLHANSGGTREQRTAELLVLHDRMESLLLAMRVAGLVNAGWSVMFVARRGESLGGLMRRMPLARWVAGGAKLGAGERPV